MHTLPAKNILPVVYASSGTPFNMPSKVRDEIT